MQTLTLREIQLSELNILTEFDKFCRKNNLHYSLVGGTLLGAVRHKGFIPWDDDIDVAMSRPDYERFIKLFSEKREEFPDCFELTSDRGKDAINPFLKLVDKNITTQSDTGERCNFLWIDIFPIDGYPSTVELTQKMQKKVRWLRRIFSYNYKNFKKLKGGFRKLFYIYAKIYGGKRAFNKLQALSHKYPYSESQFVGEVAWGFYGIGERLIKSEFEKTVELEFEGHSFQAMSCWEKYLSGIYGDYMQLPPEDKRQSHSFTAYKKEKDE